MKKLEKIVSYGVYSEVIKVYIVYKDHIEIECDSVGNFVESNFIDALKRIQEMEIDLLNSFKDKPETEFINTLKNLGFIVG